MNLPVIVFDLDDTLYFEVDFIRSGFQAAGVWLQTEHGLTGLFETAWDLFQTADRTQIFNLALKKLYPDAGPELIEGLIEVYRSHHPRIGLAPDARRLIEAFRGERLAIITDGFAQTQLRKVKALGLEQHCNPIVRTGVWGSDYWKPDPRSYRYVQDHYDVKGKDCVYIGDNPTKDFFSARALGWHTIRIRRVGGLYSHVEALQGHEADCIISDLDVFLSSPDLLKP
jgi:putative hydrolase of the HAD superfamily